MSCQNRTPTVGCTACTPNLGILSVFKITPTQYSTQYCTVYSSRGEVFKLFAYGTYFRITRKLWNFQKEHILICTEVFLILGRNLKILKFTLGIIATDFSGVGFFLDPEPYPLFKGGVVVQWLEYLPSLQQIARPGFVSRPGAYPQCDLKGGRSHCNFV